MLWDRTGLARPGVFEQVVKQAYWLKPEFIINVGDLVEGYSQDPADMLPEFATQFRALAAEMKEDPKGAEAKLEAALAGVNADREAGTSRSGDAGTGASALWCRPIKIG